MRKHVNLLGENLRSQRSITHTNPAKNKENFRVVYTSRTVPQIFAHEASSCHAELHVANNSFASFSFRVRVKGFCKAKRKRKVTFLHKEY